MKKDFKGNFFCSHSINLWQIGFNLWFEFYWHHSVSTLNPANKFTTFCTLKVGYKLVDILKWPIYYLSGKQLLDLVQNRTEIKTLFSLFFLHEAILFFNDAKNCFPVFKNLKQSQWTSSFNSWGNVFFLKHLHWKLK